MSDPFQTEKQRHTAREKRMSNESGASHPLPAGLVGVAVDFDPFADSPSLSAIEQVISPTDAQHEVWLADHLGREASLAYNEAVELDLHGPLDDSAILRIQHACQQVYQAHQALRAVFSDDGSEMLVQSAKAVPLAFDVIDLRGQDRDVRQQRLADWRAQVVSVPFDLGKGPLFRAHLLRLDSQHGVLLLSAHHLVCDGYAFGIVLRDLARALRDEPLTPSAFADYAADESRFEHSEQARANIRFWSSRYAQDIPVTDLPTDRPRPARRQVAARRIDHLIPAADYDRLQHAARQLRMSPFALLLGGFELLLSRLTGSHDVVVGIPAAGQLAAEQPHMVGHCVNLLPVRGHVDPALSTADWLAQVQRELLDAFDHQRLTFGTLLRHLALRRDPSRLPLVSVMFNLDQRLDPAECALPGLQTTIHPLARRFENFELFVNLTPLDAGLRIECQFSTALFDDASIQYWLASYAALLSAMADDPQRAVGQQPALDASQQTQLASWNQTQRDQGLGRTPVALLDRIGLTQPRKIALADAHYQLSYRALLDASHQLAMRLQQQYGIGPTHRIGLCLTRGIAMVVAQWAVWRTGAAYVPLDPHFPQERLAYMAHDADLALILADADTLNVCQQFQWPDDRTLTLSADDLIRSLPAAGDIEQRLDFSAPQATAYIIYTSGSTGKPKGVAVPHRAVANLLLSMQRRPGIRAADRLLAVTTLSFDIAVLELCTPLIAGGTVFVASRDEAGDGHLLAGRLKQWQITVMQATPGTWRLLLGAGWQPAPGFRALVGGEPLPLDLARELTALPLTLWNMYGPTETTVWSTCWQVPAQPQTIRIGGPIDNTYVRILDPQGQEVPIGAAGEIVIGGEGVALGYLNRPDLTRERFIPDPATIADGRPDPALAPERHAYRTGDRGRWRHDGTLEHLGRLDHQVKVRGYRIELGEIEAVLASAPGVRQAVTIVREDVPGDQRLVAYMVPSSPIPALRDASREEAGMLRAHLRSQLPDYMIPQHFIWLPAFALLPNGKIDRKELPRPDTQSARSRTMTAPANSPTSTETPANAASAVERTDVPPPRLLLIQHLMADFLKLPSVAVDDDFFALGGHSLLAAQLLQALGRELGRRIPLATLFEAPTPQALNDWLDAAPTAGQPDNPGTADNAQSQESLPALTHRANPGSAPLSLMQQRLYFLESITPGTPVYNTPSAHRLSGPLNERAFQNAFDQLIQRQPILRTIIDTDAQGMPQQRILDSLQVALFPAVDMSRLQGQAQEKALRQAIDSLAQEPIPLHSAPLYRTRMFRLADEQFVWFFMPHHIIWDGWSFDLLYQEMAELYANQLQQPGAASPLPALSVDYGDFALWHHQYLQSTTVQKQVEHWLGRIDPHLPPLDIPADRQRPARMSGRGSTEWLYLPESLVARLREHAREQHTTIFMSLLSVWALLLHGLSRQATLRIGTPVRGRDLPELEPIMGFFVNALPLTFHMGAGDGQTPAPQTVAQLLEQVRLTVTDAFGHSDVPADRILQAMGPSRDESRPPLWQAFFSFQEASARQLQWGNLHDQPLYVLQPGTAEDLGLWFLAHGNHLVGGLQYNTDIFDALRIRHMGETYQLLLTHWLDSDGNTPLSELLALLPASILHGVNHPADTAPATLPASVDTIPDPAPTDQQAAELAPPPAADDKPAIELPPRLPDHVIAASLGAMEQPGPAPAAANDTTESMEDTLAGVWADLLGTSDIRPEDNFFDLGGHSMLVMQAIARMEVRTGRRVNPRRFVFETLAQVARAYDEASPGHPPETGTASPGKKTSSLVSRVLGGLRKRS